MSLTTTSSYAALTSQQIRIFYTNILSAVTAEMTEATSILRSKHQCFSSPWDAHYYKKADAYIRATEHILEGRCCRRSIIIFEEATACRKACLDFVAARAPVRDAFWRNLKVLYQQLEFKVWSQQPKKCSEGVMGQLGELRVMFGAWDRYYRFEAYNPTFTQDIFRYWRRFGGVAESRDFDDAWEFVAGRPLRFE